MKRLGLFLLAFWVGCTHPKPVRVTDTPVFRGEGWVAIEVAPNQYAVYILNGIDMATVREALCVHGYVCTLAPAGQIFMVQKYKQ